MPTGRRRDRTGVRAESDSRTRQAQCLHFEDDGGHDEDSKRNEERMRAGDDAKTEQSVECRLPPA